MIRVLHIVGAMNMGGQETFIMNLYKNIDRSKIQFDFVVHSQERGYFDDEIESLGGKIYRITPISKNVFKHISQLKKVIKDNNYKIIHRHTCNSIVAIDTLVAKRLHVEKIICHSHNSWSNKRITNYIFRILLNKTVTDRYACSKLAGQQLFGNRVKVDIIPNGIDIKKFKYNEKIRSKLREQLNIKEKLVIGHVGRFDKQKNHKYLIIQFAKAVEKNNNLILILIGDGILKKECEDYVESLNMSEKVLFCGQVSNVNDYMQVFDLFAFPSIFEGLGIVLIEAQASGLKCLVSENIQQEAIVTDNVKVVNLKDENSWVNNLYTCKNNYDRNISASKELKMYNVEEMTCYLQGVYLNEK